MKENKNKVGRPKLADSNLIKNSIIMVEIALIGILVLIMGGVFSLNSNPNRLKGYASKNGDAVTIYNENSDVLIIGDSRICEMQRMVGNASYVSVWGGHYGYSGGGLDNRIDSTTRVNKMKNFIDKIVKKHGSARVFVIATINDYSGGSGYKTPVSKQVDLINKLAKYNNKASVYGGSLISERNGSSVSSFNKLLKQKIGNKYVNIKPSEVGYIDSAHFNKNTTKKIYNIIVNTDSKKEVKKAATDTSAVDVEIIKPNLRCTYNGKTVKSHGLKTQTKNNTIEIPANEKFTCKMDTQNIMISTKCGEKYKDNNRFVGVNKKSFKCTNEGAVVSVKAYNFDVIERVYVKVVKNKSNTTTTTTNKVNKTTTTNKPNVTTTTTTKLVGNNKCKVLQITPGSNSVSIKPVCGKNAKLIRVNIYKESKAVISRKNVSNTDTVSFNKLSKGKYYVGLVYRVNKTKYSASLKAFEIIDGETYSVYRYNLDTNTELCGVENSKIVNGKVTYSVKCGSNAKLSGAVLYDETNHKPIVMSTKKNTDYGFNKELTYQNSEIKTTNNYHIRLYWTTNNDNSGTGVSIFARSTSTIK